MTATSKLNPTNAEKFIMAVQNFLPNFILSSFVSVTKIKQPLLFLKLSEKMFLIILREVVINMSNIKSKT